MTIHLEGQVTTSPGHYSIVRGGRSWTVAIPQSELDACGPMKGAMAYLNKMRRRALVVTRLEAAMKGPPDA